MKVIYNSKLKWTAGFRRPSTQIPRGDYVLQRTFVSDWYGFSQSTPINFRLNYNSKAKYLPFEAIIHANGAYSFERKYSFSSNYRTKYSYALKDFKDCISRYSNANDVLGFKTTKSAYFLIDNVVYREVDSKLVPLIGLFVKNNVTTRVSLKKDGAINKAIGSCVYDIPLDSILYIHPDCLTKIEGHTASDEKLFGIYARKMRKKYSFLETTGDMDIFEDMFDAKIKAPKGFAEFEQFNNKINTHLKEVINECYE